MALGSPPWDGRLGSRPLDRYRIAPQRPGGAAGEFVNEAARADFPAGGRLCKMLPSRQSATGSRSVNFYSKGRETRWAAGRLHRRLLKNKAFHFLADAEPSNDFVRQDNLPVPGMQTREAESRAAPFVDENFGGEQGFQVQLVRQAFHGPIESTAASSAMRFKFFIQVP